MNPARTPVPIRPPHLPKLLINRTRYSYSPFPLLNPNSLYRFPTNDLSLRRQYTKPSTTPQAQKPRVSIQRLRGLWHGDLGFSRSTCLHRTPQTRSQPGWLGCICVAILVRLSGLMSPVTTVSGMELVMVRSMTWAVVQCKATRAGGGTVGLWWFGVWVPG